MASNETKSDVKMEVKVDVKNDPRFKQGLSLMKSGKFEEASEHFGELLTVMVTENNETDPTFAPLYFHYGSAILALLENESDDLGAFDAALASVSARNAEEGKTETIAEKLAEIIAADKEKRNEDEKDIEVAWENLEMARLLYSKIVHPSRDERLALAKTHDRLADLHSINSNDSGVVEEIETEIRVLSKFIPEACEHMADLQLRLMLAYCTCAGKDGISVEDASMLRKMALGLEKKILNSLREIIGRIDSSLSGEKKFAYDENLTAEEHKMFEYDGGGTEEEKKERKKRVLTSVTDVEQLACLIREELKKLKNEGKTSEGFDGGEKASNTTPEKRKLENGSAEPTVLPVKRKKEAHENENKV
mmetsp:Transcript_4147/g.6325  ORF Transcript_4147/g.6325 Transcript_4147/m.6325 type:complete len:363 (-) Transcript_4147:13-1101(-)